MPSATAAVEAHMRTHPTPEDTRTRVSPLVDSYVNPVDLNHPEPVRTYHHPLSAHDTRRNGRCDDGAQICGYIFNLLLNNRLVNIYVALK